MALLREIASLGLSARMESKLKVRQPLSKVTVVLNQDEHQQWLENHDAILKKELNVKTIEYTTDAGDFVSYQVVPNFKRLGPRVGKLMPQVKKTLGEANGADLLNQLSSNGAVKLSFGDDDVELDSDDIQVRLNANEGFAASQGKSCVVVLSTELNDELICEGKSRDVVRLVQTSRKEMGLEFSDRIELVLATEDEQLQGAVRQFADYIKVETLGVQLEFELPQNHELSIFDHEVGDAKLTIGMRKHNES